MGCRGQPSLIQLTELYGSQKPCQLCGKQVRAVHLCKVAHQAAVLQLFGSRPVQEIKVTEVDKRCWAGRPLPMLYYAADEHTCLLCHQEFLSQNGFRYHLTQQHRLANWDWNPARDRQRVVIAGCLEFKADCPTEPQSVPLDVRLAVETGDWDSLLTPATVVPHPRPSPLGEAVYDLTMHLQPDYDLAA